MFRSLLKVIFSFLFLGFIIISYSFFLFSKSSSIVTSTVAHTYPVSSQQQRTLIAFLSHCSLKDAFPNLHLWNFSSLFLRDFYFLFRHFYDPFWKELRGDVEGLSAVSGMRCVEERAYIIFLCLPSPVNNVFTAIPQFAPMSIMAVRVSFFKPSAFFQKESIVPSARLVHAQILALRHRLFHIHSLLASLVSQGKRPGFLGQLFFWA